MKKNIYNPLCLAFFVGIALHFLPLFSSAQNSFQLNGNGGQADLGNDCYRLTQAVNNQFGSAWWRKKADLNQDFDITANFNFGTVDANGADGIVFAFQNVCTSSGVGGGGIGILGVTPSFFVEFDTWQNGNYNDPAFDHVAIMRNGDVTHGSANALTAPVGIVSTNANVENGQDYLVRILWTRADSTLKVYVNGDLRTSYTGNIIASVFSGNPYVYWGFTAATGGANNLHRVCVVNYPNNTVKLTNASICSGSSYQVSLPGYSTYAWSPNTNISSTSTGTPVLSPTSSTTYFVTVTDACNNQQTDSIRITVNPLPTVSLNLPFFQKCLNEPAVALTGGLPAGGTFSGSGVSGGQFTPANAGLGVHQIYYTVTDNNNCTNRDSNSVLVNNPVNVTLGNFSAVCRSAAPFALSGGSPSGGTYSGPGVSGGNFNPNTAGNGTHTITYTYNAPNGCSGSATNTIVVNALPTASINTPTNTVICSGTPVILNTTGVNGVQYQWSLNGTPVSTLSAANTNFTATAAGPYTLLAITTATGCTATSTAVNLTLGTTPSASISAPATQFCPGASVVLSSSVSGNETIVWYLGNNPIPNATAATYTATAAGAYKAVITSASGCATTSNIITLSLFPGAVATATASLPAFCPNTASITLTANNQSGAQYQWLDANGPIQNETNQTYTATAVGSYRVILTVGSCSDTSTAITLNNAQNPTASLTTPDSSFCPGTGSLSVTATAGATYVWVRNGLDTLAGNNPTFTVTQSGSYHVAVTSSEQCSSVSESITMTLLTAPVASISTTGTAICSGNSVTLTADTVSGATYEWFKNGSSQGSASGVNTFSANQGGSYTCVVNDGCPSTSNAITLTVSTLPALPTSYTGPADVCPGGFDNFSIPAIPGATSYIWTIVPANGGFVQGGQGTNQVTITFLNQAVTVQVSGVNACGTGPGGTFPVTINQFPNCNGTPVAFGASPSITCQGSTVTFFNYSDDLSVSGLFPVWDFGAGATPATSTSNGPVTVTYNSPGLKTVSLVYNDVFGNMVTGIGYNDYVNISGSVSTSAISGTTTLPTCSANVETYSVTNTPGSTYNWTVTGGSIVSGQGTNSISVNFAVNGGSVSVVETNAAGCVGAARNVNVSCLVGMEEVVSIKPSFDLFPNPTTGLLTLAGVVGSEQSYRVQLFSMEGKMMLELNGQTTTGTVSEQLELSYLPKGVYFVRMQTAKDVVTRSVVLQ